MASDYGIKVTKPGYDVNVETDPRNFTIHSGYNMLKVHPDHSAYGGVELNDGNAHYHEIEVAHDLGYPPVFLLFFQRANDSVWKMPTWDDNSLFVGKQYTDDDTITIFIYHTKAGVGDPWPDDEVIEYRYFTCIDPRDDLWY